MDGKTNMSVKIICPYVNDNEINQQKNRLWNLPVYFEKEHARIGSDMMYQKLGINFQMMIFLLCTQTCFLLKMMKIILGLIIY